MLGATDQNRSLFLKGFKLSKQGNYEDPTYLGFKIVIDFGTLPINADDGLPPSPLFKPRSYLVGAENNFFGQNPFGQPQYNFLTPGPDGRVAYYSAASFLNQREFDFPYGPKRGDMLMQFRSMFAEMLSTYPWFIQSIAGLDKLALVSRPGYQTTSDNSPFTPQRTQNKVLEFTTLESLNLRMTALSDLYNQATFDYDHMRELLPRNLRKFTMWIFVSEIRNFFKTSRLIGSSAALTTLNNLSNLLGAGNNPGSSLGVSNAVSGNINQNYTNSSISPGSAFNSFVNNIVNQSGLDSDFSLLKNQQDQSGIKPVMVFECRNCEFDFTESTPLTGETSIAASNAASAVQKFKIHVGKVRMRSQYPNIRQDGKPMVLGDGWDSSRSSVQSKNLGADALLSAGGQLLTNFISNSLNDMINEGVSNFVSSNLSGIDQYVMGNAYSLNPSQILSNLSFNNAQKFLDGLGTVLDSGKSGLPNPQTVGQGGPPERVYKQPSGDIYDKVPGKDLGVPDRVYTNPTGDVYANVPGKDLGVPDRVYTSPSGDVYADSPGKDLGVPDRVYTTVNDDVYNKVPGSDLGVPNRVYTTVNDDVYNKVPGSDLGVPDRVYASLKDDVYLTVPGNIERGSDLGVPNRVYKGVTDDVYKESAKKEFFGNSRVYLEPDFVSKLESSQIYSESTQEMQSQIESKVYEHERKVYSPGNELRIPSNSFKTTPDPVYSPTTKTSPRGNLGDAYPLTNGEFIPEKPLNLGNLKSPDKFNISMGDFNTDKTEFI
jgi:hypothetical protein